MPNIKATAPMRIDFAGGTIDMPPLFLFHYPASTINTAISIGATVELEPADQIRLISRDQDITAEWPNWQAVDWSKQPMLELICRLIRSFEPDPVQITITSQAPAGSGLGGSSVIAIALTAALARWTDRQLSENELVEWAKSHETQAIKVPTGYQDYWAAVYGGLQAYQVNLVGQLERRSLGSAQFQKELENHVMLVYAGKPHFSGANNWELFKQHIDGKTETVEFFEQLKQNAIAMEQAMTANDLTAVAKALNQDWQARRTMLPTMSTPEIDQLIDDSMAAGAISARVCGAGGGGCVLLLVPPAAQSAVRQVITEVKMTELPVRLAQTGVKVEENR